MPDLKKYNWETGKYEDVEIQRGVNLPTPIATLNQKKPEQVTATLGTRSSTNKQGFLTEVGSGLKQLGNVPSQIVGMGQGLVQNVAETVGLRGTTEKRMDDVISEYKELEAKIATGEVDQKLFDVSNKKYLLNQYISAKTKAGLTYPSLGHYMKVAGKGYPEVTAVNRAELKQRLKDFKEDPDTLAALYIALEANPFPQTKKDQEAQANLQSRAALSNRDKFGLDAIYAAFVSNLPTLIKSTQPLLAITILNDMYEEQVQNGRSRAEELGIAYNPEEMFAQNAVSSAIQGGLEYVSDRLTLGFLKGIPTGKIFTKQAIKAATKADLSKKALVYVAKGLVVAGIGGGTESAQEMVKLVFTEAQMMDAAKVQGKEYVPVPIEELASQVLRAGEVGFLAGSGGPVVGAPVAAVRGSLEYRRNRTTRPKEETETVREYRDDASRIRTEVEGTSVARFRAELEAQPAARLVQLAQRAGLVNAGARRAELEDFLVENRDSLVEYTDIVDQVMDETINKSEFSPWKKQVFKWMYQGENITFAQVEGLKLIWDKVAQKSGYDSAEALFEDMLILDEANVVLLKDLQDSFNTTEDSVSKDALSFLIDQVHLQNLEYNGSSELDSTVAVPFYKKSLQTLRKGSAFFERVKQSDSVQNAIELAEALPLLYWDDKVAQWKKMKSKGEVEDITQNVFDAKDGIGQVPDNQEVDYKGFKLFVTPKFFRNLVPSGVSGQQTKKYIIDQLKLGSKIGQPFLIVDWDAKNSRWIVIDHEGRSRTDAFQEVYPNKNIELHVFPRGMRAKDITPEMRAAPFVTQGVKKLADDPQLSNYYVHRPESFEPTKKEPLDLNLVKLEPEDFAIFESLVHFLISESLGNKKLLPLVGRIISPELQTILENHTTKYSTLEEANRSKVKVFSNGKFAIDLFKGGNILNLQKSLIQALSPSLSSEIVDKLIEKLMWKEFLGESAPKRRAKTRYMKAVWEAFQEDPGSTRFLNPASKDSQYLNLLQRELAEQFQTYLATRKAPTLALNKVFMDMAKEYSKIYQDIRSLPPDMQEVDTSVAEFFDNLIADKIVASRSELEENPIRSSKIISEIRKVVNDALGTNKKNIPNYSQELQVLLSNLLGEVDTKKKTRSRVVKGIQLQKAMEEMLSQEGLTEEIVGISLRDLQDVISLDKISLESLSTQQLLHLQEAINALINWDKIRAKQWAENYKAEQEARNEEATSEFKLHWRAKKTRIEGEKKFAEQEGFEARQATKHWKESLDSYLRTLSNPFRTVESIAKVVDYILSQSPELKTKVSIFTKLLKDLDAGDTKRDTLRQKTEEFIQGIIKGINWKGISSVFGKLEQDDYENINLLDSKRRNVVRQVSQAEIMLWYGYMKNRHGRKHLMEGGIRFRDKVHELYKFRSIEELYSIVNRLPKELTDVVDAIILYYDQTIAPQINEVSQKLVGRDIATEENYLPLFIEWLSRGEKGILNMSEMGKVQQSFVSEMIEHQGFLHARKGGSHPVYVTDFLEGITKNLEDVALYVGMAEPIRNFKMTFLTGKDQDGSLWNKLVSVYGKAKIDNIENWIRSIEDPSYRKDEATGRIMKANQRVKKAFIKLSMTIPLVQGLSLYLGRSYGIERKYLYKVLGTSFTNIPKLGTNAKYSRKQMAEMHPYLWERFIGLPMVDIGASSITSQARRLFGRQESLIERYKSIQDLQSAWEAVRATDESFMEPTRVMDAWALSKMIEAAELKGADEGWTQEQVLDYVIHIIKRTQPQTKALYTSTFLHEKSPLIRVLFGVFQSFRDIVRGEVQTNIEDIRSAMHGQAPAGTIKNAVLNILRATLVSNLAVAALQEVVYRIRKGDDDEDELNFFLALLVRTITNTLSLVPFYGDIASTAINSQIRNWRAGMSNILIMEVPSRVVTKAMQATSAFESGDEKKGWRMVTSMIAEMGSAAGAGTANLDKMIETIGNKLK